jgi:GINS complex subunit 2
MRAMRREQVPLWVALILKSRDKCSIVPPEWLNLTFLREKYEEEIKKPTRFSSLPSNWLEISKIILARAPDDLEDPSHLLRSIIQDLREIRLVKSRKGLKELNESNIQLNDLSLLEINEIRPFVLQVMNKLRKLHDTTVNTAATNADVSDDDEY